MGWAVREGFLYGVGGGEKGVLLSGCHRPFYSNIVPVAGTSLNQNKQMCHTLGLALVNPSSKVGPDQKVACKHL